MLQKAPKRTPAIWHCCCQCHQENPRQRQEVERQCNSRSSTKYRPLGRVRCIIQQTDLAVSSSKCHPSCGWPPSDEKAEESSIFRSSTSRGPDIDGPTEGECRANLRKHHGSHRHEDDGEYIWGPITSVNRLVTFQIKRIFTTRQRVLPKVYQRTGLL